ncbi:hypothetical protein IJT10_05140, partial [bacterium]|nr:hypothetical protein [bacterium]
MLSSINFNNGVQSVYTNATTAKAGSVEFSYNSQDQTVMPAGTATVDGVEISKGSISTDRVKMREDLTPDANGNLVFDQKKDADSFTKAHTFATVNNTLKMFQDAYGEKISWARPTTEQLTLRPDRGEMLNAYYSRSDISVNFFHSVDPTTSQMIHSGDSGEVVSHEVGHAMLDGLHPEYLEAWNPDPLGFHEHFADMTGFMMATQDDATCELVAKETGGDLTKDNSLSLTGEELGVTIGHATGNPRVSIRNANNKFKWQDPSTLPDRPSSPDELGTEMHSWSQVYTGAMYDAFTKMVSRGMADGQTAAEAIKDCGQQFIELYAKTLKDGPKGSFTYKQMANCMLKIDREQMGGRNQEILRTAFQGRDILPSGEMGIASEDVGPKNFRKMSVSLDGGDFGMFTGARVDTMVDADKMFINEADSSEAQETKQNLQKLIKAGRILYTEPNQKIEKKDLFDKDGMPYAGVLR